MFPLSANEDWPQVMRYEGCQALQFCSRDAHNGYRLTTMASTPPRYISKPCVWERGLLLDQAVFEIKRNPVGQYYFVFRTDSDALRVCSRSFPDRSSLERCIAGIREAGPFAVVDRETPEQSPPRFLLEKDAHGVRFSLEGFDGERIFTSAAYADPAACLHDIRCVKTLAGDARIRDQS